MQQWLVRCYSRKKMSHRFRSSRTWQDCPDSCSQSILKKTIRSPVGRRPKQLESMKIALIQCSASNDVHFNLTKGLEALETAAQAGANLVVYPELAFTPFYPQHRKVRYSECRGNDLPPLSLAEEIPGRTTDAFCAAAKRLGVVVVLNLYAREGNAAFDASPVIDADGTLLGVTRMMHITQYEG
ncbi:MAG: hypothetical protein F4058_06115, partial [Rhodothermaceae bacterium]|nr:hypothetical protein [Rhodothermaceae bacterium]